MVGADSFFNTVAAFEVYNQHLLMDIGAFQMGLGAALLLAGIPDPADALAVGVIACRHPLGRRHRLSHRRARPRGNARQWHPAVWRAKRAPSGRLTYALAPAASPTAPVAPPWLPRSG